MKMHSYWKYKKHTNQKQWQYAEVQNSARSPGVYKWPSRSNAVLQQSNIWRTFATSDVSNFEIVYSDICRFTVSRSHLVKCDRHLVMHAFCLFVVEQVRFITETVTFPIPFFAIFCTHPTPSSPFLPPSHSHYFPHLPSSCGVPQFKPIPLPSLYCGKRKFFLISRSITSS